MNRKFLQSKFKDILKTDKLKKQVWENTSVINPNSNSFSKKYFYAKNAKPSSCSIVELYTHVHTHTHTFQFLPPSTSNQLILNWQEANPKSHPPPSKPSGYPSPLRHTWVKYNKCGSPHKC